MSRLLKSTLGATSRSPSRDGCKTDGRPPTRTAATTRPPACQPACPLSRRAEFQKCRFLCRIILLEKYNDEPSHSVPSSTETDAILSAFLEAKQATPQAIKALCNGKRSGPHSKLSSQFATGSHAGNTVKHRQQTFVDHLSSKYFQLNRSTSTVSRSSLYPMSSFIPL